MLSSKPVRSGLPTVTLICLLMTGTVEAQIVFVDVTESSNIPAVFMSSPTSHSLGVNWIDVNLDGWADLFLVGGAPGRRSVLLLNQGDGSFQSAELLPDLPRYETSGSLFGDYDRDGDLDIYIYTDNVIFNPISTLNPVDGPPNFLLRNLWVENGRQFPEEGPLFDEVAATAGVDDLATVPFGELPGHRSKSANWLDFDRDGCLDLFVSHIALNLTGHLAARDRLYRNRCDGTFEDRSDALDPNGDDALYAATLASIAGHLDGDLWPDIYVANIGGAGGGDNQDRLYRNLGASQFQEMTPSLPGIGDDAQAAMGIDIGDVNRDGHWDVYIADIYATEFDELPLGNVLYLGQPAPDGATSPIAFTDNEAPGWGIEGTDSWGVNFFDADLDGDEDLFVATMASAKDEIFYRNDGNGFVEISDSAGILTGNSRGSAVADFDRDGDLDLAVVNQGSKGLQLFRNDTITAGHWLALELHGVASSTDAIGTVVELSAGGATQKRQVKGGSSAHSQDDLVVFFGVGGATQVDRVDIYWPSGWVQRLDQIGVDRRIKVVEEALFFDTFEGGDLRKWSSVFGN